MNRFLSVCTSILLLISAMATTRARAQDTPSDPSEDMVHTLTIDGQARTYRVYIPDDAAQADLPLVVALHGRGGNGRTMVRFTGFNTLADEMGFAVAYPDGIDREWNHVQGLPNYPEDRDDVTFLTQLVDDIAARYPIDTTRAYLTGFSHGAVMAQRMACEPNTPYSGFVSVAGAGFEGMETLCGPRVVAPMLLINGTADPAIPWDGTTYSAYGYEFPLHGVPRTFQFWAGVNGCTLNPDVPLSPVVDEPHLFQVNADCPAGAPVKMIGLVGAGHTWPTRQGFVFEALRGSTVANFEASRAAWGFFSGLQRATLAD